MLAYPVAVCTMNTKGIIGIPRIPPIANCGDAAAAVATVKERVIGNGLGDSKHKVKWLAAVLPGLNLRVEW